MKAIRQRGAAAVEFALVALIFFGLLLGTVQFGWLLYNYVVLATAASTGARVLATQRGYSAPYTNTKSAILAAATSLGAQSTIASRMTITMSVGGASCQNDALCTTALGTGTQAPAPGTQASVAISYAFAPIVGGSLAGKASLLPTALQASMSELVQ
ncbi:MULTISPECIES: TadE/TadG family type IV pilus assembly protein [Ralstonia]|jgi:Flp pilus assembly protein TadG|uniref:TadE-like domain-containing protein n=1 Tax=Ralstonia flaminis TaxID=3058597 RepID=A0ABM9KCB0_9RALS|nr:MULTISPECIES: TadE/TadG family type IV pilus assembly protein [unclassified Ralstonia]CAJ0822720.1 hypothetical protein LMG18101_05149 [Ralstonia sp. LMG 18101]